jgi:hypothetical protein
MDGGPLMGVFNALVAVEAEKTHIDYNLALELERLLGGWMEGRFDWYAIGVHYVGFSAYLDEQNGWVDCWRDDDKPQISVAEWEEEISKWIAGMSPRYAIIPIRCHG